MGRTGDDSLLCLVFNMALSELVVCWGVIICLWILVQYYLRWREMTIRGISDVSSRASCSGLCDSPGRQSVPSISLSSSR